MKIRKLTLDDNIVRQYQSIGNSQMMYYDAQISLEDAIQIVLWIEPMVLQTSGYMIYRIAETAISRMFRTNQLQIEHRFFEGSTPDGSDWTYLDIKQSADDFHRITTDFKKIYKKRWVNTGASKGGMTSSYHRFFYPDDVHVAIAKLALCGHLLFPVFAPLTCVIDRLVIHGETENPLGS